MRKGALLLALAMLATAPTAAFAAKTAKAPANPNAAGQKLVSNAMMQPYYAWQSIWVVAPAKKK